MHFDGQIYIAQKQFCEMFVVYPEKQNGQIHLDLIAAHLVTMFPPQRKFIADLSQIIQSQHCRRHINIA